MTPREAQIEACLEMCLVYIAQSQSAEELNAVGQEIAALKPELGMNSEHLKKVTLKYVAKRRTFDGTGK